MTHALQVCKAAEYAHAQKLEKGDESMKHTTGDMCYTMLHYALALAQNGNFDQSECAFEKLTRTTEKTWGAHSFQLATVFIEQSKARLLEGKHHESQVSDAGVACKCLFVNTVNIDAWFVCLDRSSWRKL